MFRTKQAVDRHVQELFRKVKDENERTLRCYNVAKLYFQVQDYESARRYVSCYLEVKSDQAGPHKLLGEIYEALGQKEPALAQYKQSLEIEPRQDNLLLKVCELLADMDVGLDVNRVKYWVERADEKFPHHPTVFQLKEKILTVDRPNNGGEDLEALIAAELSARPSDIQLRVKLLKYYIDKSRLDDAYVHAMQVESTHAHRDSVAWYEALCDLLTKCKEFRQSKWTFWVLYISSLERYAALSLKEQGHVLKKTITEAAQAVFHFDQVLTDAKLQNFPNTATFAEPMFNHMWGQLHFHLACLLLRKTKREQGSWSDAGRLCAPLLLTAMHVAPVDLTAPWVSKLKDQSKAQVQLWHREGSYRCSQAGHVLQDYARNDTKRLMDKIDKFCIGSWRERIYQRIFVSKALIATSYFANQIAPNPPLRLCSATELKIYDEGAEDVWPASLHHHVWLGILNRPQNNRGNNYDDGGPHPHQYCHVFPDLQFSVFNLSQAAPDSLGQLDIDAFLNAAVLCASVVVEEQQRSGFLSPDRLPTLPADITNTLCTCTQDKWWSSAYKIYRKQDGVSGDLGEIRQELQRGLEVVRCIGNHGLHPAILVHLARIFHHRAKLLKEKDKNHTDLPFVEARCELYWSAVVPLLERLLNNQAIRTTSSKMFDYQGKEMNNVELTNALEEGRLLLAQRYIRDKQHEQAIEALQALKCPEASFMQGEIYKSLADELISTLPKESLTSAMRSQHVTTLAKARSCYYLTLDRLRSPGMNPKHPLNSELGSRITDIENDLKRIDPDLWRANRNDCDAMSDGDSYSSAHSGEAPVIQNSFTGLGTTIPMLGTPLRNTTHRNPKQASTPCRLQHQDVLELTRKSAQHEARPSPERLDAQLRQLLHSNDSLLQSILEQNKALLEANKSLVESNKSLVESSKSMNEKIEELQKQFADLRKETQQSTKQQQQQHHQRTRSVSTSRNPLDVEDLYVLNDDDYSELSYNAAPQPPPAAAQPPQIPANLFAQHQQRHPYSPLVYPQPAALQGYYPTMPFNDPHAQHMPSLYPPNVFQMPALYPRPPMETLGPLPKMPENMQGMFTSRLLNQLTDLGPPPQQQQQHQQQQQVNPLQAPQLSMQLQNLDITRNEIPAKDVQQLQQQPQPLPKDAPVNRAPPVNVVITTSDTLPTNVPTIQPTLSVTIPAQHRAGGANNVAAANAATTVSAPHSYQISMPLQATIPTTVILPPLSTTITDTISASVAEQERNYNKNSSIMSTGSHNYSSDGPELEHDPLPDFVPVIPLPAEVKVTTGEEDETSLFCARAKLYRWSEKEWKERGVGNVKLLRNAEGKVRLVMRREQVLKICANHMLNAEMELTQMMNNERAWIWVANDFADEEVKLEKLCIKFKFAEEAQTFKEAFDKAKASVPVSPAKPHVPKEEERGEVPTNIQAGKTENAPAPLVLGGFSFTSKPIVQKSVSPEPAKAAKPEETTKPSPFAGFSFTKSTAEAPASQPTGFSFVKAAATPTTGFPGTTAPAAAIPAAEATLSTLRRPHAPAPAFLPAANEAKSFEISGAINEDGEAVLYENKANLMRCSVESTQWKNRGLGTVKILLAPKTGKVRLLIRREETQKVFYNQVIAPTTKFSVLSGTDNVITWLCNDASKATAKSENIAVLFDSAPLATKFNCILDNIQRKIVDDRLPAAIISQKGRHVRILDSTAKNAAQKPLAEIFKPPTGSWECTMCYTRNESAAVKCAACEAAPPGAATTQKPLAEIFKPPAGSWECTICYTRNDSSAPKCLACEAPAPGAATKQQPAQFAVIPEKSSLLAQFKPHPDSWECQSCYTYCGKEHTYCVACEAPKDPAMPPKPKTGGVFKTYSSPANAAGFTFGIPPATQQRQTTSASATAAPPLSEMFKPQAGSWECKGCFVRNGPASNYCVACEAPKDPTMPPKPKTGIFGASVGNSASTPTFSFGIPPKDTASAAGGFTFKMPPADEKAAGDSQNRPGFGMVFGAPQPQRPSTPPNVEGTGFAFGSPGKSFDFQFSSVKSPVKSPGRGDVSEDEVAESEDVYFAPVIPLPDKVDVKTGEEDEEILYAHRAKLFRYDANAKEWKERGLGDVKLLRHNETKKLRMVMRRDQTLKLCLNHVVSFDLELKPKDDKTWLWTAADYSEGDIECLQLACRFKTPEIAGEFKNAVESALDNLRNLPSEEAKSPEDLSTKSLPKSSSVQDIQVVYEVKVTPEEKTAALKLQLPENFYAYKQKTDCPGCLGCREPEVPLFDAPKSKASSSETEKSKEAPKSTYSPMMPKIAPPKFTSPTSAAKPAESSSFAPGVTTTTTTATTTSLVFGGEFVQKPGTTFATPGSFGTSNSSTEDSSKLPEKKSTTTTSFVFGSSLAAANQDNKATNIFGSAGNHSAKGTSSPFTSSTFTAENLSICSPSSAPPQQQQQQPFGRMQSPFGAMNFGSSSSSSSSGQTSIFSGATNSGTSIFGGNATQKIHEDKTATSNDSNTATLATPFQNIFGGTPKTTVAPPPAAAASAVTSASSAPVFGSGRTQPTFAFGAASTAASSTPAATSNIFGASRTSSATPTFGSIGNTTNIFGGGNSQLSTKLSFGALAGNNAPSTGNGNASDASGDGKTENATKKTESVSFLPVENTATFSDLAAQSPQQPSFTKDPNFSFAGAGASVFGSKGALAASANNSKSSAAVTPKKDGKDDEGEDENEEDEGQEYDPHFEPIIPLPDTVEVRTGEEDEEKVFCHRAKLYRYESETKEWKERGTGEMKLLYHAEHGTYRLLLRREQVHKVVCNQLVTVDLELRALFSSDRAWMWAGVNHAEEPYAVEELAVKFKNPELAVQFKEAVEKAKVEIRERQASGEGRTNESPAECYGDEQEDEGDEEEDDEEDEEHSIMFVGRAELLTLQGSTWTSLGNGFLKILYDSEIYGAKIILEVDYTGEIASNTVISMETTMERNENSCVWTAIDEVINPPTRRTLKAVFATVQLAQDMYINFQDGQEYAKQADISEAAYYDPRIE